MSDGRKSRGEIQTAENWLEPLADSLIARHIKLSVRDKEGDRAAFLDDLNSATAAMAMPPGQVASPAWKRKWREGQKDRQRRSESIAKEVRKNVRCIAIVGAGASAHAVPRGPELANRLIRDTGADEHAVQREVDKIEKITALDPNAFEARLSAIGQVLGNDRPVREAICRLYRVRHPTVIAYELLAHLVKHRFIDAVITTNFDELLDQSLDDEVGVGEYERVVSERDCLTIEANPADEQYIPLYIKLHGTASEPESLRFTRESYYNIPAPLEDVTARLFHTPHCVVVNVGFGLADFDMHRLLSAPDELDIYNLSRTAIADPVCGDLTKARARRRSRALAAQDQELKNEDDRKKAGLEIHEDLRLKRLEKVRTKVAKAATKVARAEGEEELAKAIVPDGDEAVRGMDCDSLLRELIGVMEDRAVGLRDLSIRSTDRHEIVERFLGATSPLGNRLMDVLGASSLAGGVFGPGAQVEPDFRAIDVDAVYKGYLLRRTILELALALARGRGLVSIASLASNRCGLYFDAYLRSARLSGGRPKAWPELCTSVGFETLLPDIMSASSRIQHEGTFEEKLQRTKQRRSESGPVAADEIQPSIDAEQLAALVLPLIVNHENPDDQKRLELVLDQLSKGSEFEIHSRDDRVCGKVFHSPVVLTTRTALRFYSRKIAETAVAEALASAPKDEEDGPPWPPPVTMGVISENCSWLLDPQFGILELLDEKNRTPRRGRGDGKVIPLKLRLIVAFDDAVEALHEQFTTPTSEVEIRRLTPWRHNRHMKVLSVGDSPSGALYHARHQRSAYVTPVLLREHRDVRLLRDSFASQWRGAVGVNRLRGRG